MKSWGLVILLFVVIVIGVAALVLVPGPRTAVAPTQASLDDLIKVTTPLPNATITAPLAITGEARGNWFFEASAPTQLLDASGTVIAQSPAQAQGDWETTEYVPFSVTLTFPPQPKGSGGTLVLKNDNPSGNPATQKELDIPVQF